MRFPIHTPIFSLVFSLIMNCAVSCDNQQGTKSKTGVDGMAGQEGKTDTSNDSQQIFALLVLPKNPGPGEPFRILATGGNKIRKARIILNGPRGILKPEKTKTGDQLPYWKIDDYSGSDAGQYKVTLIVDKDEVRNLEITIAPRKSAAQAGVIWKTLNGWDSRTEEIYSAWVNALFQGCDENASWSALDKVIQDQSHNFLYNYLSLGEDDPYGNKGLIMQPDCADNPFFLRAYFSWKLGLPFGFHLCDRGYVGRNPRTSQWITNESSTSKSDPVLAFNNFLRVVMNGVHSGTARTALDDENSDYYPVSLERESLRPGVVYADPYGHTLIVVGWVPQTNDQPGQLLAVDAQPDGTVGIKRFWKGNFLFNTSGVIGEPGFKTFRPLLLQKGVPVLYKNKALTASEGFVPYSLQQRKMNSDVFYHTMERLINPKPLDPEAEMLNLIQALYEQLIVRVTSVANGEAYLKMNPGTVIPMPANATGIFQAGGQWENFSTPNRDLRLLIALDAVLDFPDIVIHSEGDYNISRLGSPEQAKKKLETLLNQKTSELSISYARTNGSIQKLTLNEILKRKDAFEMTYNPNDGIEIRWGAGENSDEVSTCRRFAPKTQHETMNKIRPWFHKRLHPPT